MPKSDKPLLVNINLISVIKVLGIIVCLWIIYLVRDVVLILLTALVLASALEPMVRKISSFGIPRVISVLTIYVLSVAILFVFSLVFIPPLLSEVSTISTNLPEYIETIKFPSLFPAGADVTGGTLVNTSSIQGIVAQIQLALAGISQGFFQTASFIFGGALSTVLVLVISFYLAVEERGIENFLRVVIPKENEPYIIGLWRRTQAKIGLWLQGQMLLGLIVGVLVYLGLTISRVPYATTLAVLAALLEVIPIFGPLISAIPAIIIGFSISPTLGFVVLGLYIVIQQFENHLIYPLVVTKIVGIPPIIVIVALLVGSKLGGMLGFLLAIPLTTVIVELFSDFEKRKFAKIDPGPSV